MIGGKRHCSNNGAVENSIAAARLLALKGCRLCCGIKYTSLETCGEAHHEKTSFDRFIGNETWI
jgi:hypothetical protein